MMMFRKQDTHIHFIGIGGIGMSGIAEVLLNLEYQVTGTDLNQSEITRRLEDLGATIHRGHDADFLKGADVVVVSSAVKANNPEVVAAREQKIPVIPRAEMLSELMRLKRGLAIAGSHGKTTTTSMVSYVLHEAGRDPTSVIGGKVNCFDSNARLGRSELMVAEADESDGSFLFLSPTVAVITNIDDEHLDHYGSMDKLLEAFTGFANRVPFYGSAIICIDDANIQSIVPNLTKRVSTYGLSESADYRATQLKPKGFQTEFHLTVRGQNLGNFVINMPGQHNVLNALATIAMCDDQQVPFDTIRKALLNFSGVQRRFTTRGEVAGITVVDDYGHHPTELDATLSGARAAFPERRIIAAFQPHRFSRVRDHLDGFASSLNRADHVFLSPVYPAGEAPIDGVDSQAIASEMRRLNTERQVDCVESLEALSDAICEAAEPGDLVLILGAGSITHMSQPLLGALTRNHT